MNIQNHGEARIWPLRIFEAVLDDIAGRALPDAGLYRTTGASMQYNGLPLETLSAADPRSGDWAYHFSIVMKPHKEQPEVAVLHAILAGTNKSAVAFFQDFEIDDQKLGNLSFEVVKFFLEKTGKVTTDREGIELMYPAYGLEVPPLIEYEPNTFDPNKPRSTEQTPLPNIDG